MSRPARECSSPMTLSPKFGSQSSSPLDSTASLMVGLIFRGHIALVKNCRPCLFKVQQTFVSALLAQCFKDKDKRKDKNKRHSRWFPLKISPRQKMRRCSNIYFARWPVYKLAEQYPKKYSKADQKRAEEEKKIADQENIPLQPPAALTADLDAFF